MHNAPSVIYPVGRCRFLAAFLALLALAGLGMLLLWWTEVGHASFVHGWLASAGAVLWLVWATWATWNWRRSRRGRLEWDSQAPSESLSQADGEGAWRWRDGASVEATRLDGVALAVDLQILALLRLRCAGCNSRWIWVEQWREPARWNDLRRALHSTLG
ncbi:MAG: hypothetical protein Q8M77_01555 [Hydrogenophaga sp.]|jgi:hypothetical protein|nr:hypothetical protein [Hydrogenophaga sp.]